MNSNFKNNRGFTLLEVLIAIALLGFIGIGIYQATTGTFRLRDILINEGDFYNGIRMSMGILDRDVSLIYSPILMKPDPQPGQKPVPQEDLGSLQNNQTTTFWSPATDKTGIRPSRFIGSDTKLSFITVSHVRIYKDAPESEFAKVTYELQPDKMNPNTGLQVLVRTESANAFSDDESKDKSKRVYPLLHGIKKLKYRFYRKDKDKWEGGRWDSDSGDYKNIYPDIVEVFLEVDGPSKLHFEGTYHFRPEVPLRGLDPST